MDDDVKSIEMLQNAKDYLLEMFFPSHCVLCDRLGNLLCNGCKKDLLKIRIQICPFCNKISQKGRVCSSCRSKTSLTGVISCFYYKDERVKDILHPYKYEGVFSLSVNLTDILEEVINNEGLAFDIIAYVPMAKKYENKRGYNQSKLLAEKLSHKFNKPFFEGMVKNRGAKTQVGLPRKERFNNLKGAFSAKGDLKGKKVLVIDDVITTGATLNECAKVLRKLGAREVWAATIAKE